MDMKDQAYKLAKQAFVSDLTGGSVSEINIITAVAPVGAQSLAVLGSHQLTELQSSVLLWSTLQAYQHFFIPYTPLACLVDFLINFAAILLATTAYAKHVVLLNLMLLLPVLLIYLSSKIQTSKPARQKREHKGNEQIQRLEADPLPQKPFVTTYRGTMMTITSVAILAVDFRVFPRRFAKTENWGTSLMDLGVGSFVFSAGMVAARPLLKQQISGQTKSIWLRLRNSFRHSLPLFFLGVVRLYTVKELDYAEHVSEYGVHWNFFFTLALINPFVAIFDAAFSLLPSYAVFSLMIGVVYELALAFTDLKGFILTAPRVDWLSKNREGVFSIFGYLSIFLAGQATGMYTLPRVSSASKKWYQNEILRKLLMWSLGWTTLFFLATSYRFGLNLQVSRRLANLAYILWVCAFNTCQITLFCAIERGCFPDIYENKQGQRKGISSVDAASPLLRALNRNGLAVFLLANLLTGLVNLTLPTLSMGDLPAMGVLFLYGITISGVALLLDGRNVSIKL